MKIVVETGGWLNVIPEGTVFVRPSETGISCFDIDGMLLGQERLVDESGKEILTVNDLTIDWKTAAVARGLVG